MTIPETIHELKYLVVIFFAKIDLRGQKLCFFLSFLAAQFYGFYSSNETKEKEGGL